jgi:hypothetical protein
MSLTKVSYSMIEGATLNVMDYGAVGNGVADDTSAIQSAVDAAKTTGKSVFLPVGSYRITEPIDFSGNTKKFTFEGESNLQTVITADFASVTKRAALSVNNTTGQRVYVGFRNFRLQGISDPNTVGIYCNWTGSFSLIENVFVNQFYDGIVVANDYYMKVVNCISTGNLNNGLQFGYEIDGVAAPCNNNMVLGGLFNANGANGISVESCRALGLIQCSAETNKYANIYLSRVYGGNLSGVYMEFNPAIVASPIAQLYMVLCRGISINGLSVSAFETGPSYPPIIHVDTGCVGVFISGVAIEAPSGGLIQDATGIKVTGSFGVQIASSLIYNTYTGVLINSPARVSLQDVSFSDNTTPVAMDNNANNTLVWDMAVPAQVAASSFGALCKVDIGYIDGTKNEIDGTRVFQQTVAFSDLAGGSTKKIIDSILPSEQWRIVDIIVVGLTAADAGGDRGLGLTDGTSVYTVVPAATLKTLNFQGRWGSTNVPFSAVYFAMIQRTVAGSDLVAYWSGGTTDYSAGSFVIQVTAERVA